MTSSQKTEFESVVQSLQGKPCWGVQAGAVGSMASLHFGERIALEKPLPYPNPQLAPEEHRFRGEFILYIEDCPWRIDGRDRVLATWLDSNAPNGPIVTHMRGFIGQTILTAELTFPGYDLVLMFSNQTVLRIFPDQNDADEADNYTLSTATHSYTVGPYSQLVLR